METQSSIAVTKPDMTLARQESLSPFGLLSQLFTEELVRRSARDVGMYRPMQLVYLEEEDTAAPAPPPEIHFDLNVDLLLQRLGKDAKGETKAAPKAQGPAERIIERVIERERELRTVYQESRRVVIEGGGRRTETVLPLQGAAASARSCEARLKLITNANSVGSQMSIKSPIASPKVSLFTVSSREKTSLAIRMPQAAKASIYRTDRIPIFFFLWQSS